MTPVVAVVCLEILRGRFLLPVAGDEGIAHAHHLTAVNSAGNVTFDRAQTRLLSTIAHDVNSFVFLFSCFVIPNKMLAACLKP